MSKEKTKQVLNQAVADLSQFSVMIHQVHWYLRGSMFLTMHSKMDEYKDEIDDQLDQIAERLIIIGGSPYSTLAEFSANTKLSDRKGDLTIPVGENVKFLIEGYRYLHGLYQQGIDAASEENDAVTEDLFTTLKAAIDKNIWMLSAVLEQAPEI